MFNIGMMELVLVLLVAFLVVGPKDLPKVARWIARQIRKLRKLIRDVKKETGWEELVGEFKEAGDEIKDTVKDADVRSELKNAASDIQKEMNAVEEEISSAASEMKQEGEKIRTEIEGGTAQ